MTYPPNYRGYPDALRKALIHPSQHILTGWPTADKYSDKHDPSDGELDLYLCAADSHHAAGRPAKATLADFPEFTSQLDLDTYFSSSEAGQQMLVLVYEGTQRPKKPTRNNRLWWEALQKQTQAAIALEQATLEVKRLELNIP